MSEKRILKYKILALSLILGLIIGLGAYLYKQHLDRIHEEEIKKPYKEAGLSDKQANEFIAKYPEQNGNSTWVSFAKAWVSNGALADKSLKIFGNLKDSLDYMYFVNNNSYDGLNYLEDLPKLAENYKEVLPAYSKNSALVKIVYDQFQRDPRINLDRNELFLEALKVYQNLGKEVQRFSQIYALNNATSYFGSYSKLVNEIGNDSLLASVRKLGENDGINRDFDNARKHVNMLRLAKHVENILKYPKEWREGAIQVDDVGYRTGMAFQDEAKFWSIVEKAVRYVVDKLDSGEAEYELNIPDKKIEAWYRRQRLLPIDLFEIDIVSGYGTHCGGPIKPDWMVRDGKPSLEVGWRNVSPDSRIGGKTPQQWLEDIAKKDFREKTLRYQLAMMKTRLATYPEEYWPKSYQAFMDALDIVLAEDPEAAFIIGYVRALRSEFLPWNLKPLVPMEEPTTPYYAVLVARCFGKAAFVVGNDYPDFGAHDSPYVKLPPSTYAKISQKGETLVPYMFGEFPYKKELKEDHINYGGVPANPRIRKPDGSWEGISL